MKRNNKNPTHTQKKDTRYSARHAVLLSAPSQRLAAVIYTKHGYGRLAAGIYTKRGYGRLAVGIYTKHGYGRLFTKTRNRSRFNATRRQLYEHTYLNSSYLKRVIYEIYMDIRYVKIS